VKERERLSERSAFDSPREALVRRVEGVLGWIETFV